MLKRFNGITRKDKVRIEYIIDSIRVISIVVKCKEID